MRKVLIILGVIAGVSLILIFSLRKPVLRVGMDLNWEPFEMKDSEGNPDGVSVDIAYELGNFLDTKVEIIDIEFSLLIDALLNEEIDVIIASMTGTEERSKIISFSDPYMYFSDSILLNKDFYTSNQITTLADLMAIENVSFISPEGLLQIKIVENIMNNPVITIVPNSLSALLEVVSGNADAFPTDSGTAGKFQSENSDTTVVLWDPLRSYGINMGVRKEDSTLLNEINMFIEQMESSGFFDELSRKYDDIINEIIPGQDMKFLLKKD